MQMTMMDKNKIGSDNLIGLGLVDVNPVITNKKPRDEFRCILTRQKK